MSASNSKLACLRKLSTEKMALEVNSWDSAIRRAKLKILELKLAIETFQENKKRGEPWPTQSENQTN